MIQSNPSVRKSIALSPARNARSQIKTASRTKRWARNAGLLVLALAAALFSAPTVRAAGTPVPGTAIVWVADVSGSMPEIDPQRLWTQAVSLGVDIAPDNTEAAFIAVNNVVRAQTELLDVSQADNAAAIKQAAQTAKCTGDTDFSVGLLSALNILNTSQAKEKDIFFIGDISESGFLPKNGDYSQVDVSMTALTQQLAASGIKVHLIFLRTPEENKQFMPLWDDLAAKTGGEITNLNSPATLQEIVESLYFSNFSYHTSVMSGINTTDVSQDIPINIPSFAANRIRIYVTAESPLPGIQARADSTQLSLNQNGSYDIIDLTPPLPQTVTLTLPPGESNTVKVYLLADGEMTLAVSAESSAEKGASQYRQKTTVSLTPALNDALLFNGTLPSDVSWTLTATDPSGQETAITTAQYINKAFVYDFYPRNFGAYTFSLTVTSQGMSMTAESTAEISEIKSPIAYGDYSLWIAISAGALLILAAVLFAVFHRRRGEAVKGAPVPIPLSTPVAVPEEPAGTFAGKLDIYGVLVDGGKAEIPATSYRLGELARSKCTTLAFVMKQAGIPYAYPAAAHIRLLPGTDCTLIVKNDSNAAIYCGGQLLNRGQQTVLDYGQKMRVIFEEDVSEYEVYYHNAVQMAVSGSSIHLEFDN